MATNFLLGRGERLTKRIPPPAMISTKKHPYSFAEAKRRLAPRLTATADNLDNIPAEACPNDEAVAVLTIHPAYLAKTYFPEKLLEAVHIQAVGSRPRSISPAKSTKAKKPPTEPTAELFVAGSRQAFRQWAEELPNWTEQMWGAGELIRIEDVRDFAPEERIRPPVSKRKDLLWEIVLHANELDDSAFILDGFREYLHLLDVEVDLDERLHAEGLCFLPLRATASQMNSIAKFSFLRCARELARLRPIRSARKHTSFACTLPTGGARDSGLRVAILDGGLPPQPRLQQWVQSLKTEGVGTPVDEFRSHGLGVTSAFLFGPLERGTDPEIPYAGVDHYQILDDDTNLDEDLFPILRRIQDVLQTRQHEYLALCVGPDIPIEDDEVHVWTAVLDDILSTGQTLPFIAVGNSGKQDWESGNARIQSPADCVNGMAIGAADSLDGDWKRAEYSSIGPGRCPGVVKPDSVAFGGSEDRPFWVLGPGGTIAVPEQGTSFAAPYAMRMGVAIRAHLGGGLNPLTIKALLAHCCDANGHDKTEVGWGRIPRQLDDIITCEDDTARIIYQGELQPTKWVRTQIPVPTGELKGNVHITATFCFATEIDPQDPIHYTRGGLEIVFRPHDDRRKTSEQTNPDTRKFFQAKKLYPTENNLRRDAHKWETMLHSTELMRWSTLKNPCFDVHCHARDRGRKAKAPKAIPYALVITVRSPAVPDLYNRIVRRYRTILEQLRPVIEIPIRTRG